jgi:hypothetical protein
MKCKLFSFLFLLIIFFADTVNGYSKGINFSMRPSPPPKIIRTCCSFGSEVGIIGVPYFKLTEITSIENVGKHEYLGCREEGNGIIYTRKGGFIDLAHLRDQADWTAYLYYIISTHKGISNFEMKLGHEGGAKTLTLNIPQSLSDENSMILAGRIAYDLSVWHEIATWFGANSIPFVPERYSSFSVEDDYSNLLGATLGIKALESNLPFEKAMTKLLDEKLFELERVDSISQTYAAMERVLNEWWTRDYKFPQANVTLKRNYSSYSCANPLIVPGFASSSGEKCVLQLPRLTDANLCFEDLYTLSLKLNMKLRNEHYFVDYRKKTITNRDFLPLIDEISSESDKLLSKVSKKYNL